MLSRITAVRVLCGIGLVLTAGTPAPGVAAPVGTTELVNAPVASRAAIPKKAEGTRITTQSPCQQVVFIGAQGSGERADHASGLGGPVNEAWLRYRSKLPQGTAAGFYPLPYPAAPADVLSLLTKKYRATFYASIDSGVRETLVFLRARRHCTRERYVLAGYSQGAMAVERAVHWILKGKDAQVPSRTTQRIDGVLLIASGDRVASRKNSNYGSAPVRPLSLGISNYAGLVPGAVNYTHDPKGRVRGSVVHEVCQRADVVCDTDAKRLPRGVKVHSHAYSRWSKGKFARQGLDELRRAATHIARRSKAKMAHVNVPGKETGRVTFTHPTWGLVRLITSFREYRAGVWSQEGFITVVDIYGRTLWTHRTGTDIPYYEMALNKPARDRTGQIFINWNPGRYNGVTVLRPVSGGFASHGTLPDTNDYNGRFYYAEVTDVERDGTFEIIHYSNDCDPSCAGGTITQEIYHWNGHDYVRR